MGFKSRVCSSPSPLLPRGCDLQFIIETVQSGSEDVNLVPY